MATHVTRRLTLMMLVSLTCFGQGMTLGQEASSAPDAGAEEQQAQPTPPVAVEIAAAEISDRSRELRVLLREVAAGLEPGAKVVAARDHLSETTERVETLAVQTRLQIAHEGGLSALEDTERQWVRVTVRLDEWLESLSARVSWSDTMRGRLGEERKLWEQTLASEGQELPEVVRQTCADAITDVTGAEERVLEQRSRALTLQNNFSALRSEVNAVLIDVRAAVSERRRSIWEISSPPLWNLSAQAGKGALISAHVRETVEKTGLDIRAYVRDEHRTVVTHAVITFFLIVLVVAFRRPTEAAAEDDANLLTISRLLGRPVASALLISSMFDFWLHNGAPSAIDAVLTVVLVLAVLRLLPLVIPRGMRRGTSLLLGNYLLYQLAELVPDGTMLYRMTLLGLNGMALWSMHWFLGRYASTAEGGSRWSGPIRGLVRLLQGVLVVALFTNVIGSVMLSNLLIVGVLSAVYSAVLCWLSAMIVEGIVAAGLRARGASRLLTVRAHRERILSTTRTLVRAVAVVTWLVFSLYGFDIWDWAVGVLRSVMDLKLGYGDLGLELRDVVFFVITIWASFKVSAFLRFVLDEDVVPRVDLPRGVPAALSKGLHYTVLLIGFGLAVTAAGFDLSKVTLVAGALSVGIGFGLQNVVNNFVSGLILLFERPVKIGDRVQLGELLGVVKEIGMRASVVRTWQGAEVIVPNSDLLSNQLINWTLSDSRRSAEVHVGVAYGTDVERVQELLVEVARAHPDVLDDPEPVALFLGFGDSSLDFELRCWTTEWFQRVKSDVAIGVNRALGDAGIEIPFPQRDLHVRSDEREGEEG